MIILTEDDVRNFIRTLLYFEKFKGVSIDIPSIIKEFMQEVSINKDTLNKEKTLWQKSQIGLAEPNVQIIKTRSKLVNPILELLFDFFDLEVVTNESFNNRHLAYLLLILNKNEWKTITYLNAYDSIIYYRKQYKEVKGKKKKRLKYVLV